MTIGAVGEVKTTLDALLPRLAQHDDNPFLTAHVESHRMDVETAQAETFSGPDAAISGTYLTKVIKKQPRSGSIVAIPTILVTAYPDDDARACALNDGVVCYLRKPVDENHLVRCLRAALHSDEPRKRNS